MSTPINKLIHYKNAESTYLHNIFDIKGEFMLPYAANDFQKLVPKGGLIKSNNSRGFCNQPLFNKVGFCNIIEKPGEKGALYIRLQSGKMLPKIHCSVG